MLLFLDFLKPVGDFMGQIARVLKIPFELGLGFFAQLYNAFPPTRAIGAYGLAIITVTILIKALLFPLFQQQLKMTKKTQSEQKRIQPELAELRKKYKKDPQKLNQEMMALYKEHNINPLSSVAGCLPTLAQLPVLIGLYQAIIDHHFFQGLAVSPTFLGFINLSVPASLNNPITWILPVLAGLTTFVQTRMMAQPKAETDDPQAAQMQQVTQSMSFMMPLLITFFAFQPYALQGMVLYWSVSNLFSIAQQYTVNGWGQLPILGNKPKDGGPEAGRQNRGSARTSNSGNGANGKNGRNGTTGDVVARRTPTQAEADQAEATAAARVRRRQKQASNRRGRR